MLNDENYQLLWDFMTVLELPVSRAEDIIVEARTCFLDYHFKPDEVESVLIFEGMFRRGMTIRPKRNLSRYDRACKALFDNVCGYEVNNNRLTDALIVIGGGEL